MSCLFVSFMVTVWSMGGVESKVTFGLEGNPERYEWGEYIRTTSR